MHEIDLIYIWDIICPPECCVCSSLMVLFHLLFCGLHCCTFTKIISVFLSNKTPHPIYSEKETSIVTISFSDHFTKGSTNIWTGKSFVILSIPTTLDPDVLHLQFYSIHRAYPEGHSVGLKLNSLFPRMSPLAVVGASSGLLCHGVLGIELK